MGCNVLRRERVGDGDPQANFEVEQTFLADPGQLEVEKLRASGRARCSPQAM